MINEQTLQGSWNEIKGKVRSKWGSLTDDDLAIFNGSVEQLVGMIQRKTGEARESIEQYFEHLTSDGAVAMNRAGEAANAGARRAAESVREASQRAADATRKGYAEVENIVRQRPAESLAVVFCVGVVTGVAVSLLLRWR